MDSDFEIVSDSLRNSRLGAGAISGAVRSLEHAALISDLESISLFFTRSIVGILLIVPVATIFLFSLVDGFTFRLSSYASFV